MLINEHSSDRLKLLRLPLIIGVVFVHAYDNKIGLSSGLGVLETVSFSSKFIPNLISQGVARIAVPLFFLMSGYFLFLGFSWSIENYRKKLFFRFKTLLVPFIFWNVVTLLCVALAQSIPATQVYFSGENPQVSTFGVYEYVNSIVGFDQSPISYQFWFIRDLMLMVLLTPLIWLIIKGKGGGIFLYGVFLLWFFNCWPVYIPSVTATAFFYAGAYFAYLNISLFALDRFGRAILASYLILLLIDTLSKEYLFNSYIHNFGVILGVASALYVSRFIVRVKIFKNVLMWGGGCSFFIFAVHEPLLTVLKKVAYRSIPPSSDGAGLFLYLIIPIIVISLSMLLYLMMMKFAPKMLSVISGGRLKIEEESQRSNVEF